MFKVKTPFGFGDYLETIWRLFWETIWRLEIQRLNLQQKLDHHTAPGYKTLRKKTCQSYCEFHSSKKEDEHPKEEEELNHGLLFISNEFKGCFSEETKGDPLLLPQLSLQGAGPFILTGDTCVLYLVQFMIVLFLPAADCSFQLVKTLIILLKNLLSQYVVALTSTYLFADFLYSVLI